jgi:signal peptidase I
MQPTLIPGDYILVEKWTMGGRIFDLPDAAEGKEVDTDEFRWERWMKRIE